MAFYYTFNPPTELPAPPVNYIQGPHTKPGITNSFPDGRLGKYQLPYGPYWEASYSWLCYHEDPAVIKWIEDSVLGHFRHQAFGMGAGMTEWVTDTTWQEIRDYVLMICRDTGITIIDCGPGPWNPVRIQNELKHLT